MEQYQILKFLFKKTPNFFQFINGHQLPLEMNLGSKRRN